MTVRESTKLVFGAAIALASICWAVAPAYSSEDIPPIEADENGVLVALGMENGSSREFEATNWAGIKNYECSVHVDCDTKTFPYRLHVPSKAELWDFTAVESMTIHFRVAQDTDDVVLVVSRFGTELDIVQLDHRPAVTVTHDMMNPPSDEGVLGRFELPLGMLKAGSHTLKISLLDDGRGSGRHSFDALGLRLGSGSL